ncbi:hypothetical protein F8M41_024415 [Gigaspora margarita]|uniref:HMG box domain-containing protein n=1 Tax=Gigaspora margarita TaxID=4874 RepID=A0A8H3XMQ2_GIGMA|nr:hypothetical protein F8M41_024415 [Gigaspora margarita]
MDFDNFTPIENTDLLSNLESSKGITVFIPNEYSPVLAKYPQFSNHEVSSFLGQLWSESSQEIKDNYRQHAKDIKLEYQKQNSGKYTYKKKSAESSYKRKRLDTNHENNGGKLTEKVKQILNFHLNNSISKESNETNNCKGAYSKDSNERNNDQKDYSEETKEISFDYHQPEFVEYDIFDLNSSSQIPLEATLTDGSQQKVWRILLH